LCCAATVLDRATNLTKTKKKEQKQQTSLKEGVMLEK
jgi:hypothetical protein